MIKGEQLVGIGLFPPIFFGTKWNSLTWKNPPSGGMTGGGGGGGGEASFCWKTLGRAHPLTQKPPTELLILG